MTAIVPITHDEERLARQAGNHLCRAGQFLLQKGTAPAQAEVLVLAALADKDLPSLGPDQRAEVESLRPSLRGHAIADPALAVAHFLAEFGPTAGLISGLLRLPSELVWLMDALAAGMGGWAYCPFSLALQSAVLATRRYESAVFQDASPLDPLMEALLALFPAFNVWGGDPLAENAPAPSRPLDCVISAGPLARRITPARALRTLAADSAFTSNGELLRLDLLVDRRPRRLVSLVSWGFLAGTRRLERLFKASLLGAGILDAVVQLPGNLVSGTRWNAALLVVDAGRDKAAPVRLVDASEGFHEVLKGRFTQARLKGWREVADCFEEDRSDRVRLMDGQALVQADCDITPRRHVQEASAASEGTATRPLRQLVSTVRGQVWPEARRLGPGETVSAEHLFLEAAIKDIGADGLLRRPEKGLVYSGALSPAQSNQLLRPGDILLSCKGSVGKVALVPEECGPNWVPSQSFQVLRPLPGTDPICLFHQLRSPALQDIVAHLVTGGTVPQIKAADMGNLPIPVIEAGEAERIRRAHKEVLNISAEIANLKQKREKLLMEIVAETKQ
ncbi:MAG TPA: restriction endonuclease subunit S [Desulfovibrio sp.]|uniref:restriction endonuclease subunit S n=1 Tax=Desulfovibrio sp. TaxID=885 RepID=UPI002CCCDEF5|nr:restriction endonuclease subunit S [Desulfovibrio sp.]HMM37547.1 restriction endonuclease subunit S [Desulfovibrio sp.]